MEIRGVEEKVEEEISQQMEGMAIVQEESKSRDGFQETSVGSPGSQFLYDKDASLQAKQEVNRISLSYADTLCQHAALSGIADHPCRNSQGGQ